MEMDIGNKEITIKNKINYHNIWYKILVLFQQSLINNY